MKALRVQDQGCRVCLSRGLGLRFCDLGFRVKVLGFTV